MWEAKTRSVRYGDITILAHKVSSLWSTLATGTGLMKLDWSWNGFWRTGRWESVCWWYLRINRIYLAVSHIFCLWFDVLRGEDGREKTFVFWKGKNEKGDGMQGRGTAYERITLIHMGFTAMSPAEVTEKLGLHRMKDRSWYVHPRYVFLPSSFSPSYLACHLT